MASQNLRARLRYALGSGPARDEMLSQLSGFFPTIIYVSGNQSTGQSGASDNNDGLSFDRPLATMTQVMANIALLPTQYKSNGLIVATGSFKEHVTAPLGAYGWTIIGATGGVPRHSTSNGVFLDSNGVSWVANAGSAPLLILREQGWTVKNFLFVPQSGYGAIQLNRQETASYPDASHAEIAYNKFIAPSTRAGYGIDDSGASYHTFDHHNEYLNLEFARNTSGVGIAAPGTHYIAYNTYSGNKHDITGNFYGTRIEHNDFRTPYNASNHPNTVNLAYTSDAGSATDANIVRHNTFADAAADVTIAKGYKPATGDIWRNWVTDTADEIVAVPA